jgi:glycosyltransferase involved in cell wall biosynthesis
LISKKVIVLSEPMKAEILSYFSKVKKGQVEKKIFILVNFCFDLDCKKVQSNEDRKIDILYAGNHGPSQGLMNFLEVIAKIQNHKSMKISFYGDGTQKNKIIQRSIGLNLNIKFNDPVPRDKIKEIMAQSRFGLVSMDTSLSNYAFPSKLAAYLSSGTKVIISSNGEDPLKDYVKKYNFGFAIDSSNVSKAAKSLIENLAVSEENSHHIFSKEVLNQFDKKTYFKTLDRILYNK